MYLSESMMYVEKEHVQVNHVVLSLLNMVLRCWRDPNPTYIVTIFSILILFGGPRIVNSFQL